VKKTKYNSIPEHAILIANDNLSVAITPSFGAIYNIWNNHGAPLLWQPGYPKDAVTPIGGCFPLVPYANRVKNSVFTLASKKYRIADNHCQQPHALHGDGWTTEWRVLAKGKTWIKLGHRSHLHPFNYRAEQTIEILDNSLSISISITHLGDEPMPYGVGFHPWFIKYEDTQLYAPATRIWYEDHQHFPTKTSTVPTLLDFSSENKKLPSGFINNLFNGWQANDKKQYLAEVCYPSINRSISIQASEPLNRYMLYQNGSDFFCFEPVSHNVDAHNNDHMPGLKILTTNQNITANLQLGFNHHKMD
jgi:aldose 1-epimerase